MKEQKILVKAASGNIRGFLRNLFEYQFGEIEFIYQKNNIYEVSGRFHRMLSKVIKWRLFDLLGIFQVLHDTETKEDVCFSYNRFIKTTKPYVICLENPSALVNYCWNRPRYSIAKKRLKRYLNDSNLQAIVCISKTCCENMGNLYDLPLNLPIEYNYPLVSDSGIDVSYKRNIAHVDILECLFVSSQFELKGGRDILEVFEELEGMKCPIHITLITRKMGIREQDLERIRNLNNVTLVEFNLNKSRLDEYYKNAAVLIHPTRGDSMPLVSLEAMKQGCLILATDIYAIKEVDVDGYNGFLTKSMYKVWESDGTPNKYIQRHLKQTTYSGDIDKKLVIWMKEKLLRLLNDRDLVEKLCTNSLKMSQNKEFGEKYVAHKWESILLKASRYEYRTRCES